MCVEARRLMRYTMFSKLYKLIFFFITNILNWIERKDFAMHLIKNIQLLDNYYLFD